MRVSVIDSASAVGDAQRQKVPLVFAGLADGADCGIEGGAFVGVESVQVGGHFGQDALEHGEVVAQVVHHLRCGAQFGLFHVGLILRISCSISGM